MFWGIFIYLFQFEVIFSWIFIYLFQFEVIFYLSHTAYTTVPILIFVLTNKGYQVNWHFVLQSICTYYTFGVRRGGHDKIPLILGFGGRASK